LHLRQSTLRRNTFITLSTVHFQKKCPWKYGAALAGHEFQNFTSTSNMSMNFRILLQLTNLSMNFRILLQLPNLSMNFRILLQLPNLSMNFRILLQLPTCPWILEFYFNFQHDHEFQNFPSTSNMSMNITMFITMRIKMNKVSMQYFNTVQLMSPDGTKGILQK
jgi:hypothetical protein